MVTTIRKYTGGAHPFLEFACLSTDTKPVDLVPDNSICHEIDTGKKYYIAGGVWHEAPSRGGSSGEGSLPANFPTEGAENANKFAGFDENGLWTAKDAPSSDGAEKFVVTLTQENGTWTADEDIADIVAAYEADKIVVALYPSSGMNIELPLNTVVSVQGVSGAIFVGIANAGNKIVTVQCTNEGSGDVIQVLEQTVENASAPLIVTLTAGSTEGQLVGDKTCGEVYTAFTTGKNCLISIAASGQTIAITSAIYTDNAYVFGGSIGGQSINTNDGVANDYINVTVGG